MSNRQSRRSRPPPDPDPDPDPGIGPDEEEGDNCLGDHRATLGFDPAATTLSTSPPTYTTAASRSHPVDFPDQRHLQHHPFTDFERQQDDGAVERGGGSTRYGDLGLGLELGLEPQQTQAQTKVQVQAQARLFPAAPSGQELSAGPRQQQQQQQQHQQHQHQHQHQHQLEQHQHQQEQQQHQQHQQHQQQQHQQHQHLLHHQHQLEQHQLEQHQQRLRQRQRQRSTAAALAPPALELEGQELPRGGPPGPQQLQLHDSHQHLDHDQRQHHLDAQVAFLPPSYHPPVGPPQPQPHHPHHRHHPPHQAHPSQPLQQPHQPHQLLPSQQQQQTFTFAAHPPLVDPGVTAAPASSPPTPPTSSGTFLRHPHDPRLLHAAQLQTIPWFPVDDSPDQPPAAELHSYAPTPDFYDPDRQPHHDTDDPTLYHQHQQPPQHQHQHPRPPNWPFVQLPYGQTVLSMHPELSILNAESYHDGTASSFRAPRSLPPRPTPTPTTPGADEGRTRLQQRESRSHGTKRSTAQAGDALDEGDMPDKKKRGRPKLDTDDQTAQDRRRTQIRLAQRAYRNRKETAILTLEKQVEELKQTNEKMSNAFMRLYDYAVGQGMLESMPEFGRQLQATTQTFVSLARSTSEDNARQAPAGPEHESEEGNTGSPGSGSEKQRNASGSPDAAAAKVANTINGQQVLFAGLMVSHEQDPADEEGAATVSHDLAVWSQPAQTSSSAPAYEIVTQPTVHNASFPSGTSTSSSAESLAAATLLLTTPYLPSTGPMIPTPTHALPPPTTLSFQERTFGRRLQRAALEQALRLMAMPAPPPATFAAVFGFCLLFESRDRIVERVANCLSVNRRETLSNWRHPFLHLGGAGTFFQELNEMDDVTLAQDLRAKGAGVEDVLLNPTPPRPQVGNRGTDEPHRSKVARESIYGQGPWSPLVEETRDLRVDHRLRITTPGFEGDFFDCDEVEWYFHQRGVVIPPAADFVTAEIDDATFGRARQASPDPPMDAVFGNSTVWMSGDLGVGGPSLVPTPGTNSDTWSAPTVTGDEEIEALLAAPMPPNLMDGPVVVDPSLYDLSSLGPDETLSPRKRLVTVNVQVLVDELIQRSVCLGRAPGVRPKDVDASFWKAVVV